jgi:aldose sugar dehydrogenase
MLHQVLPQREAQTIFLLLTLVGTFYSLDIVIAQNSTNDSPGNQWNTLPSMFTPRDLPTVTDHKLKVQLVADGLKLPTMIVFIDSNHILALEKSNGTVRMIEKGTLLPEPILDVNVSNKFERGMLGIALSSNLNTNVTNAYLYFTETKTADGKDVCSSTRHCLKAFEPMGNRLYKYDLAENKSKFLNPRLILEMPNYYGAVHNGGVILFGPDGNIYLTVGELGVRKGIISNHVNGKTPPDGRGGILIFDQNGKAIKEEGVLGVGDPLNKYFAYGIRNSFGMDFDPITGKLWDTENGPGFGDEINLVEPGFNSGWSKVQGIWMRQNYYGGHVERHPEKVLVDFDGRGKYSEPEFTWNQTVGPTALRFLNSDKYGKEYENDMFVGSANNNGILYHFDLYQNRTALDLQKPLDDKVANNFNETKEITFGRGFGVISDLKIGPDGYLYVVSLTTGSIHRIVPQDN